MCGSSGSIEARIEDCATQNGATAIWEGAKYGKGGEGDWKLVTLRNDGSRNWEVWRDERTKLLWSDSTLHLGSDQSIGGAGGAADAGSQYNWFQAAGYSHESASTQALTSYEGARQGSAAAGARAYAANCSNPATQTCQPATPISVCADASLIAGLNGVATYSTPDHDYAKGGLSASSTPAIRWRLPTIQDWQQANVNGIRFVLPNLDHAFWSATSSSTTNWYAWYMTGDVGAPNASFRWEAYPVRCVAGGL